MNVFRIRRASTARRAPVPHAPASQLRVEVDEEHGKRQQADADPDHESGPRLPLQAEHDQVTPGPPGARRRLRGVETHAWSLRKGRPYFNRYSRMECVESSSVSRWRMSRSSSRTMRVNCRK